MLGLAFWGILWQTCRGIAEGITMYQPGPRAHPMFYGYHWMRILEIASLYGVCAFLNEYHFADVGNMIWFAGLSVLAWEAFELSYLWARQGQATGHENILGLWAFDGPVWWLHAARAGIGVALMIGGIK